MAFKIVIGYDGSEGAKAALAQALDLARQTSGKVFVAYAYGGPKQYSGAPLTPRRQLMELGERLVSEALERASGSGVAVEPVLVEESAAQGLLKSGPAPSRRRDRRGDARRVAYQRRPARLDRLQARPHGDQAGAGGTGPEAESHSCLKLRVILRVAARLPTGPRRRWGP